MSAISLDCGAKVNLYLHVNGRRDDGYHEITTLFQRISLYDTVTLIERPDGIALECSSEKVPAGEDNLAWRAAAALADETGCTRGALIRLVKRIPVGAGLGGGSSDAAGVLIGLNRLWELGLSRRRLAGIGARLGADVPFFVSGASTAVGTGRGDIINPLPPLSGLWFVLANPGFEVSAGWAYSHMGLPLTPPMPQTRIILDALGEKGLAAAGELLGNSLQNGVVSGFPGIGEILAELRRAGLSAVLVSGSGPTAFGIATSLEEARRTEAAISRPQVSVFLAEAA